MVQIRYSLDKIKYSKELKTLKGIVYKITNLINNKCYIGISMCTFLDRYRSGFSHCKNDYLLYSINKYGKENFSVEILEKEIYDVEELSSLEIKYIEFYDSYKNGYNLSTGGEQGLVGSDHPFSKPCYIKTKDNILYKFGSYGELSNFSKTKYHSVKSKLLGYQKTFNDYIEWGHISSDGNLIPVKFDKVHNENAKQYYKEFYKQNAEHKIMAAKERRDRFFNNNVTIMKNYDLSQWLDKELSVKDKKDLSKELQLYGCRGTLLTWTGIKKNLNETGLYTITNKRIYIDGKKPTYSIITRKTF